MPRTAPVIRLWTVLLVALAVSRGGNVNQNASNLFNNAGDNGFYWSSTPNSNASNAYDLRFNGTSNINPSDNNNRQNGFSVRCPYCARSPQNHKLAPVQP